MQKPSLRKKIRRSFVAMISLVVLLSSITAFWVTRQFIEERYFAEVESMIYATNHLLDDLFLDAGTTLEAIASQVLLQVDSGKIPTDNDLKAMLQLTKNAASNATTLYFGTEKKTFHMWPERYLDDAYDPRVRTWYILAKGNPQTLKWSEPYTDIGTGELVVTGSYYINRPNSPIDGVFGVDILLGDLREMLLEAQIGTTGDLMLISRHHDVLISSDTGYQQRALGTINPALVDLEDGQRYSDSKYTYFKRQLDNTAYYIVGRISNTELHFLSFITFSSILGIGILVGFLVLFSANRISKKLTDPILALTAVVRQAKGGVYDQGCTAKSDDEVGELIDGFNELIKHFNEHQLELTALYEELYASEETLKAQYDELFESRDRIQESESRYRDIFEASKEGLWALERDGRYILFSSEWYKRYAIDQEAPTLEDWRKLMHPDDKDMVQGAIDHHIRYKTDAYSCEFRVLNVDNQYRWIHSVGKATYDADGKWLRIVGSHIDITERKATEAHIRNLAYKDALTELGNRFALQEFLEREIAMQHEGALLFIDIDNFKYINDTFGHPLGDMVLKETARRLEGFAENHHQLARFSGDEYLLVLCGVTHRSAVEAVVKRLLTVLKADMLIDERVINISISIGVTIYPKDAEDLTHLLRYADLAMYAAKDRRGTEYAFYDERLKANMLGRIQMENYLKSALTYEELFVQYQPIVSLPSQQVEGFEALVRWQHPEWGLVPPDQFIPVAEKNGFIIPLGLFVLESALKFIRSINENRRHKLTVAVNISVIQLMHVHFEASVSRLLDQYDVSPTLLKLEVTESIALEKDQGVIGRLLSLRQKGIGISLDDFGSGHSSINNLLNLPLSTLKIDKQLVHRMVVDDHIRAMVVAVLSYCQATHIDTVAEGVETREQLKALLDMGFDAIQGYYYAKPLDSKVVDLALEDWVHEPFPGGDFD